LNAPTLLPALIFCVEEVFRPPLKNVVRVPPLPGLTSFKTRSQAFTLRPELSVEGGFGKRGIV
jgi:hypothetical protein